MCDTLTVKQAADKIGVHPDTIYTMVREKQIPHVKVRRRIFFRSSTLDSWMSRLEDHSLELEVANQ